MPGLFRSTGGGQTWKKLPIPVQYAADFEMTSRGFICIASDRGVFLSTDNGDSWPAADRGLPDDKVLSRTSDDAGVLYASSLFHGVYRSETFGTFWQQTGLREMCMNILFTNAASHVFAARGFYSYCDDVEGVYYSQDRGEHRVLLEEGLTDKSLIAHTITPDGYIFLSTAFQGVFWSLEPIFTTEAIK